MSELSINGGQPVRKHFLAYSAPDFDVREEQAVLECLRSGWLTTGPRTKEFEKQLCEYTGSSYALGTNSCTAALHLSLLALGIGEGDEVITTPLTFAATVNVIEHVRATPVLVDIKQDSYLIDPLLIKKAITARTRAIIPVHYAGLSCDMDAINEIARANQIAVIEDAAHAIGSEYKGKKIGNGENLTCFSFYATKNLAAGEGGVVTTSNAEYMELMSVAGLHGLSHGAWQRHLGSRKLHYEIIMPGFKYNMPDLNASIAAVQLAKLNDFLLKRQQIADAYKEKLVGLSGLILPEEMHAAQGDTRCAWHLYPVMIEENRFKVSRDEIMRALLEENIGVATFYRAIFDHKYYKEKYQYDRSAFPNARYASDNVFCLPMTTIMDHADQDDVVRALNRVLDYYRK